MQMLQLNTKQCMTGIKPGHAINQLFLDIFVLVCTKKIHT